jgi:protein involved in plasmid replication-relaxation
VSRRRAAANRPRPLPAVAVAVLHSLYQHRLLSTAQLRTIQAPDATLRHVQALLAGLERRGLARHARGRHGLKLWHLTQRGADAAEASGELDVPRRLLTPERAAGPLQAHTLAVNEVGIAFLEAARQRGDEFGPLSWRHEVAHAAGPARGRRGVELVIADALLTYLLTDENGLSLEYRFVELDRATLPLDRLAAKLARYARLARHIPKGAREPGWRSHYPTFPGLLVVLADRPRPLLERRRDAAIALCQADGELARAELSVSICLLDDLTERGPFAPIFARPSDLEPAVNWLGEPDEATSGRDRRGS